MIKHFVTLVVSILLAASTFYSGVVAAQGDKSSSSSSQESTIWSGLWAGANLDIEGVSNERDTADATSKSRSPRTPSPNATSGPSSSSSGIYAALGDSVAAGLGLPVGGVNSNTRCGRSTQAYPYEVAKAQGLSIIHIACSSAKAGDLFSEQGVSGPNIAPQLDAAFASGTPELITITAGANDVHWDEFLSACYTLASCNMSTNDAIADGYMYWLREIKLPYLFYEIQTRSSGSLPMVIMTGYYNPLSSRCTTLQQDITVNELSWLNNQISELNRTLQEVSSRYSFVKFVPINFSGHDICSAQPWVQGLNDPAPFHPNAQGQKAIAQAVIRAL